MKRWAIPVLTAIVVTVLAAFNPLEVPVRDFLMRRSAGEPARSTVIVAVDERSIKEIGPWPWDRTVVAEIIARAAASEAKAVVLDMPVTDARPGDEQLARELRRIPTIATTVPAPALRGAVTVASRNFDRDRDGIVRRFSALSIAAASASEGTAVEGSGLPAFRTPPSRIPIVSATDVLWRRTPAGDIRNRILFLGATTGDRVRTPVSPGDPAIAVHAAAAESLVRGERVRVLPAIVSGILGGVLMMPRRRWLAAVLLIAVVGGGYVLLTKFGIAIPVVILGVTAALSAFRSPSGSPESSSRP